MQPIAATQSSPRHIASHIDVKTTARRLRSYAYAELRLMEAQAGWIASIPQAEFKIELGYQIYENACHVDAMRRRLPEVGGFEERLSPASEAVARFCDELTNADDALERFVGVYWVLLPHLVSHYRGHISQSDSVADFPTVRLLKRAVEDHERFIDWGHAAIRQLAQTPDEMQRAIEWRTHLLAMLNVAGCIAGERQPDPTIAPAAPRYNGLAKRFVVEAPARDSRFRVEPYIRHEGRAATDVWDFETFVKYMFMMVEGELEATENCGRTLFDFPDAPWELRFAIAKQLWDESRHAELSLQRFLELGGTLDMLPVRDTFPLYLPAIRNTDLGRRLAHLNQVLEGWVTDDFAMMIDICREMGDEQSARLFEYLITDEWFHIKIGADWIPKLTANNPTYRAEIVEYRIRTERELYDELDNAAKETAEKRGDKHGGNPLFSNVIA